MNLEYSSANVVSYSLSISPPIHQPDVVFGGFLPYYTGNICISVYRLNIHEAFEDPSEEDPRTECHLFHSFRWTFLLILNLRLPLREQLFAVFL